LLAGWPGLVVGFLWSTVLVYHVAARNFHHGGGMA
jgi:tetrahydromethanopterin S-methyltransferase subunit F